MRLPKLPGFTNHNRVEYAPVNVARLEVLFADGDVVDADALVAKGVIKHITVKVDKVSASAQAKIEAAGGKVEQAC